MGHVEVVRRGRRNVVIYYDEGRTPHVVMRTALRVRAIEKARAIAKRCGTRFSLTKYRPVEMSTRSLPADRARTARRGLRERVREFTRRIFNRGRTS